MIAPAATASGIAPAELWLRLDVRGRIPAIVVTRREARGGSIAEQHVRISAGLPRPNLSSFTGGADEITALDVLEHVRDEERWLEALAEIANPGARLLLRMPRQSPLTGLDGFNAYRYVVSITNRGGRLRETRPTGWHRYYPEGEIVALVEAAGFRVDRVERGGINLPEPPRLGALMLLDWLLERPGAERRARALADEIGRLDRKIPAGPLSTRLLIAATRV